MKQLCTRHNLWNDGRCPRCALESGQAEVGFADHVGGEVITTTEVANKEYRAAPELPEQDTGPSPFDRLLSLVGVPFLVDTRGNNPGVVSIAAVLAMLAFNVLIGGPSAAHAMGWRVGDPDYIPAAYAWAIEDSLFDLVVTAYFGLVFSVALEKRFPRISLLLGYLALGVGSMLIGRGVGQQNEVLYGGHAVVMGLVGAGLSMQSGAMASLFGGRVKIPFVLWAAPFLALRGWAAFNGEPWQADVICLIGGVLGAWFVEQRLAS